MASVCQQHTHVNSRTLGFGSEHDHARATELAVLEQQARAAQLEARERLRLEEELNQRRNELVQARKLEAIALLSGGIAHDFNNFLTVIESTSDYLLDSQLPTQEQRCAVLDIREAADRAAVLAARLLALSHKNVLKREWLTLDSVVRELYRLLRRVVGAHGQLLTEFQGGLGEIQADRAQLEQVLLNLVVNARDALTGSGRITIRTRRLVLEAPSPEFERLGPGSYALLEVSDNGCGIAGFVKTRVFEPFFTTKSTGTGLGLSTVQTLVHQNGGAVSVCSAPGEGSTFLVAFPERQAALRPLTREQNPLDTCGVRSRSDIGAGSKLPSRRVPGE
jgi:two-component system cell cycle sensor histidine kinase/response regulator CckA